MDKTLGEDFIPDDQKLKVAIFDATDFCSLKTVELVDSISTSNFTTYGLLGMIDDSRMGKTQAGFASTFIPSAYYDNFGGDSVAGFDSVFLFLDFSTKTSYGLNKTTNMQIEVYELTANLYDSAYNYVYGVHDMNGGPSGFDVDTIVDKTKNLVVDGGLVSYDSTGAYIRLSNELLPKLWKISSADTFKSYFKGLYVTVNDGTPDGCIKYANIAGSSSSYASSALIAFYNTNDTTTSYFTYHVYSYSPRFNYYQHDYKALTQPTDVLYMQGLVGVATELTLDVDAINAWASERNIAINRAELILPVEDNNNYDWVNNLYSSTMTSIEAIAGGGYSSSLDAYIGTYFGGAINRSQMQYTIGITNTLNEAVSKAKKGEAVAPQYLVPGNFSSEPSSILISNKPGGRKPQLRIWYGEIK